MPTEAGEDPDAHSPGSKSSSGSPGVWNIKVRTTKRGARCVLLYFLVEAGHCVAVYSPDAFSYITASLGAPHAQDRASYNSSVFLAREPLCDQFLCEGGSWNFSEVSLTPWNITWWGVMINVQSKTGIKIYSQGPSWRERRFWNVGARQTQSRSSWAANGPGHSRPVTSMKWLQASFDTSCPSLLPSHSTQPALLLWTLPISADS